MSDLPLNRGITMVSFERPGPSFPARSGPPSNPSGIGLFDLAPSESPLAVGPFQRAACRFRHTSIAAVSTDVIFPRDR
ncbi:hypothetical protein [Rhizobium sp. 9140]|uniref:hypothetical protein n=1 Tax=Rhizobium sp. 9140 TaxID=1761900 RepID=UPI001112B9F1|nr:hypothetical protein [Rhizobium sp. 9140]